jgi:hypothetical protein
VCRGVHEWSTEELEEHIAEIERWLQDPVKYKINETYKRIWSGRLDAYKEVLKERAEAGTYLEGGS